MKKCDPIFSTRDETFSVFARHVSKGKVEAYQSYGLDLVMGGREGIYLYDAFSDRRWINCHCNGGVFNLGHRNPRVIAALTNALECLDVGNHHLVSPYRAELARRLAKTTDDRLPGVVFGVSGGEAIDLALKVARGVTGRTDVISAKGGYHGHTGLAMAAGDEQYRDPYGPNLPGFVQVPFNDPEALENQINDDTAAVMLEAIPATFGIPIPKPGYMRLVRELCDRHGAKFILDEVQTGLGRTGNIWYYQNEDVVPDILVTGKGLSGGIYPVTATLMTDEIHRFFQDYPFSHLSTFGGADIGCVAAMTVLDIIEEPGFLENVRKTADRLVEAFAPLPFDLRHCGLMMGFKFPGENAGMMAAKMCYDAGMFCVWAGNDTSVMQFLPPLILNDEQTDELIGKVREAFGG